MKGSRKAALFVNLTAMGVMGISTAHAGLDYVPGEMIVKFKSARPSERLETLAIQTLTERLGSSAVSQVRPFQTDSRFAKIRLSQTESTGSALEAIRALPEVEYAEPNYIVRALGEATGIPNDPEFKRLWGLSNTGQVDAAGQVGKPGSDIGVLPVWQQGHTGSKNVLVAVIDTGVNWDHNDLKANLFTNAKEIGGNGVDDDGNGFIDDIHGWNFADNTPNSNDDHGHGSHCSGTIGGAGNDGVGIAGVNWNVSILPVKFLTASGGGTTEGAIESVKYATKMGAQILSNSWGGGSASQALEDAIKESHTAGALFVAAAGNDGKNNDVTPTFPAGYQVANVLSVAAIDNQDKIASFSNYGKSVNVAAPGVKIYSSILGQNYDAWSGTSMATPHVAGAAALLRSVHPGWSALELKDRLIKTSEPVPGLRRLVAAKGRINVANALSGTIPPSQEPDDKLWKSRAEAIQTAHPYEADKTVTFKISHPGAKYVRVVFENFETESKYDAVAIVNAKGEVVETLSGKLGTYESDYVLGDELTVRFTSDKTVQKYGFDILKSQYIE